MGSARPPSCSIRRLSVAPLASRVASILLCISACDSAAPEASLRTFEEAIAPISRVKLDESREVINVNPIVRLDPLGGFLIADSREAQIRHYHSDGTLDWKAGRRGGGAGEFTMPTVALRLATGNVLAVDLSGRLAIFDAGGALMRTSLAPIREVQDADVVNDSLVLLSGLVSGTAGPRLHVWHLYRDTILRSFFQPFPRLENKVAATLATWVTVDMHGDTAAAVSAVSDTVYLLNVDEGLLLDAIPIPSQHFRPAPPAPTEARVDPRARAEWMSSFDLISDLFWFDDGRFLIGYQSRENNVPQWNLLLMDAEGERLLEVAEAVPRLLSATFSGDSLYFVDPRSETPDQWLVARLRGSR